MFSQRTILEVVTSIFVNLTSAWFGIVFVSPGFLGGFSIDKYLKLLTTNLLFGIFGLAISLFLTERSKYYE
jgi:hypothetical protein